MGGFGAWNLPPAMHRLSYLVGGTAVMSTVTTIHYGAHWPLVARLALAWLSLVAIVVAAAAATRRSAYAHRNFFFKNPTTGLIPWPAVLLLLPYHTVVQILCWFYRTTSGENVFDKITDKLYLGGWPLSKNMLPSHNCAILDCTNELLRWVRTPAYMPVLVFESWAPEPANMRAAVNWALAQQKAGRDVLVHCTHGHGRSAVTAAAVLMGMGGASTVDEAMAKVVLARPGVKPNFRQIDLLREWAAASGFKPSAGTSASGSGAAAAAGMAASGPSAPEGARATQREEEEEEEESSTTTGLEATTAKGDEQALGTAGGQEVRFKEE